MKTFKITEGAVVKGIDVRTGPDMRLFGIPLGQGLHKELESVPEGKPARLHFLDIVEEELAGEIVPTRAVLGHHKDRRALVLLDMPGIVSLASDIPRDVLNEKTGRVQRIFNPPISEAVGVQVLASGEADDGPRFLVRMQPGSAFKILRRRGVPRGFSLRWEGDWKFMNFTSIKEVEDMTNWRMRLRAKEHA